jgi:hypothetical protein
MKDCPNVSNHRSQRIGNCAESAAPKSFAALRKIFFSYLKLKIKDLNYKSALAR